MKAVRLLYTFKCPIYHDLNNSQNLDIVQNHLNFSKNNILRQF